VRTTIPPAAKIAAAKPPAPTPPVAVPAPVVPQPHPEMAEPPPPRGSRPGLPTALILGGAAFVFVLMLAVAVVVLLRHRQQQTVEESPTPSTTLRAQTTPSSTVPPPPPSVAPARGALHVESTPPGAAVAINGENKGVTPLDVPELPFAVYEVRVDLKGYQPQTQSVALTSESPAQELKLALKSSGPVLAVADVLSVPFGATVTVDGSKVGQTPLTDLKVKPGNHQFEISKEGYEPYVTTVRIDVGKRGRVDAQLKPTAKATATPPPADDLTRVFLNLPTEVDTVARKTSGKSPEYPKGAPPLRSGESVSASVTFIVTESGDVTDVVVSESGGKFVDEAVMAAVRSWKYSPATKKGSKVKVKITLKQTFRAG
jgi:TonB family protein